MHRNLFYALAICLLTVVLALSSSLPVSAATKASIDRASTAHKKDPTLVLTQGMAEIIDVSGEVADIMVANPTVVDVSALQSGRLYLVGVNLGTTNVIALDSLGNVISRLNVHVKIDDTTIQNMLGELFPDEEVKIHSMTDQAVLTGRVSDPGTAQRITNLVAHYISEIQDMDGKTADEMIVNLLNVSGKQQVMLRVRVLELSRSLLQEVGSDTDIEDFGGIFGTGIAPQTSIGNALGVVETGVSETPLASLGIIESVGAFGPISTVITMLEEDGLARVLAEPNLTAISGEQAGFLAGGEFPVPSGRDSEGNVEIEFRAFGVSLNFTPVVLSEERISLQLLTEVSSISRDNQVTLAGLEVPGLDIRRASTTVEMGSGGTLMIAGLLESQVLKNMSELPGIGDVPVLGDLMESESFRRDETELIVLVSPYLVQPFADKEQAEELPPAPAEPNMLAKAFADNIKRTFWKIATGELFKGDDKYGYLLK